jgi:hypothetical protein
MRLKDNKIFSIINPYHTNILYDINVELPFLLDSLDKHYVHVHVHGHNISFNNAEIINHKSIHIYDYNYASILYFPEKKYYLVINHDTGSHGTCQNWEIRNNILSSIITDNLEIAKFYYSLLNFEDERPEYYDMIKSYIRSSNIKDQNDVKSYLEIGFFDISENIILLMNTQENVVYFGDEYIKYTKLYYFKNLDLLIYIDCSENQYKYNDYNGYEYGYENFTFEQYIESLFINSDNTYFATNISKVIDYKLIN